MSSVDAAPPPSSGYRRPLTIAANTVSDTLTDFPVLVNLPDDAALAAHASKDGRDIVFVGEDQRLAFELEAWDDGDLRAWVRLPTVSGSSDTTFYLHYGDGSSEDTSDAAAVWADFAMVWHLEQAPASIEDSTAGGHDAESVTGSTSTTAGYIGNAVHFDGFQDYIDFGTDFPAEVDAGAELTVTAWAMYDSNQTWAQFITKASDNGSGWAMGIDNGYDFLVRAMNNDSLGRGWSDPAQPSEDTWYHWAMVYQGALETNADRLKGYRDAVGYALTFDGPIPSTFDADGGPLYLGCTTWNTYYCIDGVVDEVHVSTVARSPAWIEAEYLNQKAGSTFVTVGPEEPL